MLSLIGRYPGNVDTADAGHPYGKARDISAPGALDGTPYQEDLINDIYHALYAVLVEAGVTPSGVAETVTASDFNSAINSLIAQGAVDTIDGTLFQEIVTPSMLYSSLCAYGDPGEPVYWRMLSGGTLSGYYLYPYDVLNSVLRYAAPYSNTLLRSPLPVAKALLYLDSYGAALPNGSRPRIRKSHYNPVTDVEVVGSWLEMPAVVGMQTLVFPHTAPAYGLVGTWKYEIDNRGVLNEHFRVFGLEISRYNR